MSREANYYKLGLFTLIGAGLLVFLTIAFGAAEMFKRGIPMETYLDESVQGLSVGSSVKFRGVDVGRVSEIGFVGEYYPESPVDMRRLVVVRAELDRSLFNGGTVQFSLAEIVRSETEKGMRVRLASSGLTGVAYLSVDYVTPERNPALVVPWQPEVEYIPSASSLMTQIGDSVEKLTATIENANLDVIAANLDKLIVSVNTAVEDAQVRSLSDRAAKLLDSISETNERVLAILNKPEMDSIPADAARVVSEAGDTMEALRKDMNTLVGDVKQTTARANELLAKKSIDTAIDDYSAAGKSLRDSSAGMPQTMERLDRTLSRLDLILTGQQQDLEAIVQNIRIISQNLKDATDTAREYPSLVLFGDPPKPIQGKKK